MLHLMVLCAQHWIVLWSAVVWYIGWLLQWWLHSWSSRIFHCPCWYHMLCIFPDVLQSRHTLEIGHENLNFILIFEMEWSITQVPVITPHSKSLTSCYTAICSVTSLLVFVVMSVFYTYIACRQYHFRQGVWYLPVGIEVTVPIFVALRCVCIHS